MFPQNLRAALVGVLLVAVSACSNSQGPKIVPANKQEKATPAEIGKLLFEAKPFPRIGEEASASEPIRITQCHLTVLDKVDVPSKEEGTIEWIGVEANAEEVTNLDASEKYSRKVDGQTVVYRRLRIGAEVKAGQVIALLNDERAFLEHDIAVSNIRGAEDEHEAAKDGIKYYKKYVEIEEKVGTPQSLAAAYANLARANSEASSKNWQIKRTQGEAKKAKNKFDNHTIRAPISGKVVQLLKQPGEGVRVTEPILQIQSTERLGVEGYLEVQYIDRVALNSRVFVEPDIKMPPQGVNSPHTSSKPITSVAVGKHKDEPIIVSASEDGSVYAWSRAGKVHGSWKHVSPVRAVACTRPGAAQSLAITGCDDGKARLWSLAEIGRIPVITLDGHHEGGVQAAAFSPDGESCLTSDDRGDIFLWNTKTGKLRYTLPREHNSAVTTLQFTPQCRLISAGRDSTAYVWKVGEQSAAVEIPFEHRSGEVHALGVSDDGGQMLLDLDKTRLRVVDLSVNRNLGTLRQTGEGSKFAAFALFSPVIGNGDDRVILTTGGSDGVLQLFRWTSGSGDLTSAGVVAGALVLPLFRSTGDSGRGSELRKLVCTGYAPATCAAFSPEAKDGFIAAGTRTGDVQLWPMPTERDLSTDFTARIISIDPSRESSGKTVRIYAELDNKTVDRLRLHPGTTATLSVPVK